MRNKGIGGHTLANNGRHELWLTPPQIITLLGEFDLDPCACPEPRPWPTAKRHIALPGDGLAAEWSGRVFLNPPYGTKTATWLRRMAEHRNGIALIFARTETECWTQWIWPVADSVLFLSGRLFFYLPDGSRGPHNAGGPSAIIAYTIEDTAALVKSGIAGALVRRIDQDAPLFNLPKGATP